jgi:hypothetical protein
MLFDEFDDLLLHVRLQFGLTDDETHLLRIEHASAALHAQITHVAWEVATLTDWWSLPSVAPPAPAPSDAQSDTL